MKQYQRALMAVACSLVSLGAVSAHADVLNIPVSAGMLAAETGSQCIVHLGTFGVTNAAPETCGFEIPVAVPAGHTIQQISVVHGTNSNVADPYVEAALWAVDVASALPSIHFPWSSSSYVLPDGSFETTRLMAQGKAGNYLEAFVVPPNTMYQVVFLVGGGAFVTGLQVTYQ